MKKGHSIVLRQIIGTVLVALCTNALADEATGKVVWVDTKNSALLIECTQTGCAKIPAAKAGETYTFAIPEKLRSSTAALKEGQTVTVQYTEAKEGNYTVLEIKQQQ